MLLVCALCLGAALAPRELRFDAGTAEAIRYLGGFWAAETNGRDQYRWSRDESTIRLFGLEADAPVVLRLRLSAARPLGEPWAQLTLDAGRALPPFEVAPTPWRRYEVLLPPPPRDAEARVVVLRSATALIGDDPRDLGVALSHLEARQLPRSLREHLPDSGRALFLVALGVLGFVVLRQVVPRPRLLLLYVLSAALVLSWSAASIPAELAFWLPNLWLLLAAGWLAVAVPALLHRVRPALTTAHLDSLVGGGLAAVAIATLLLPLQRTATDSIGWSLLVAGGGLLGVGLSARDPVPDGGASTIRPRSPLLRPPFILLGMTLLALLLRLVMLNELPIGLWRDEARHGLLALRILDDPGFRPVYVPIVADLPALLFYLAAGAIDVLGTHIWTVRLVSALAGALMAPALYFAARPLVGARAGLLAAFLMAVSVWNLSISRIGFPMTVGGLLTLLGIGFVLRALENRPPTADHRPPTTDNESQATVFDTALRAPRVQPRPSFVRVWFFAVLGGVAVGLATYGYHASRFTPLAAALVGALVLGLGLRRWRAAAGRIAVMAAVALAAMAPLIAYGLDEAGSFNRRVLQTSLFNEENRGGRAPAALIGDNLRAYLGMWHRKGDNNPRHNLPGAPMLDPVTGMLAVAGVSLAFGRLREPWARATLAWAALMLLPGVFAGNAPHTFRSFESLGPTLVLAGLGGAALWSWYRDRPAPMVQPRSALVFAIVTVLLLNGLRYFVAWPAAPGVYSQFYVADTRIGELAARLSGEREIATGAYRLFVPSLREDGDVLRYLTYGLPVQTFAGGELSATPGELALLVARGECAADGLASTALALGPGTKLLAAGPPVPTSGCPEFLVYGRGPEARRILDRALDGWPVTVRRLDDGP